jgi:transcriptional regulator with GAF, ATPase, and Fis domain
MINGRWEVIERIGGGAQGDVLAVRDRATGDELVLKTVRDGGRALIGEFAHLARLADPALPRVHDLAIAEDGPLAAGTVFFTAERVDGAPLLDAIAAARPDERPRLLWSIARDVAGALAVLHAAGLLHHDVTPANVLLVGTGAAARAVLVDLGLATSGRAATARGTPAYLAPEALAGDADARSDLYALGATLHHAARGAPPFEAADLGATITSILTRPPPRLPTWLGGPLAALIDRLLAKRAEDRFASAVALARALDDIAASVEPPVRPRAPITVRATLSSPSLVGADDAIATLTARLDAVADGGTVPPAWVTGPHGSRAADVVAEALRRHQLSRASRGAPPLAVVRGGLDDVARALDVPPGERLAGAVVAAAHRRGAGVVVDVTGDDRADALATALTAAGPGTVALIAIHESDTSPPLHALSPVRINPVTETDVARLAQEMLGREIPRTWARALHRATRGLPGLAAEVIRLAAARADDPLSLDPTTLASETAGVAAVVAARAEELDPAARAIVHAAAVWDDGRAPLEAIAATARDHATSAAVSPHDGAGAIGAAIAAGVLRRDGDALAIDPRVAAAIVARLDPAEKRALHRAALAYLDGDGGNATPIGVDVVARAAHLVGAGDAAAPAAALDAAAALLDRGAPRRARALAEVAAASPDPRIAARGAVLVARAATSLGDYAAARAAALDAVARAAAPDVLAPAEIARARLVAARAAQRAGDLDTAEAELTALASELGVARHATEDAAHVDATSHATSDDAALRVEVAGARARLLVSRGRHDDALAIAEAALATAPATMGPGAQLLLEAAGLAAFYRGDLDAAEARFAELERAAEHAGPAISGRAAALAAMVALQRGDLAGAAARQQVAAEAARTAGDFHAAAVADLNLATTLAERGRHGDALPVLARAIAALDALGARGERAAAEFNRGTALIAVGDVEGAEAAARAALGLADGDVAIYAELLLGDIARRRGEAVAARKRYDAARERAAGGHARLCALAARAELALAEGDAELARVLVDEAAPLASAPDDLARVAGLRAGLATDAIDDAVRAGRAALAAGRADRAWRTLLVAAEAAKAAGRADAATIAGDAADVRRALVAATPEAWRGRLDEDPDARRLAALVVARPKAERPRRSAVVHTLTEDVAAPAVLEIARLRRLLALSKRLNGEHVLERLLDDVIDAAIEMTEAERGFLLLRPAPGQPLQVVVARNFALGSLDDAAGKVSRSIAERAATSGEPVITVDAGVDERFGGATSVAALRLRSVMAVPLRQKGRVIGCIYVDHRLRDGAFDDRAAGLALDLGDIAAVAIENTRLAADLRRRQEENDALTARLAKELDDRDDELTRVRAQLGDGPGRGALGGRYEGIIGESPAIVGMLAVVDRAAKTELPVVIVGESGTGKELVARALHDHGARRDKAFVAVNCSAMPEPLLESELFGHVRGAFTGADRDRRGLFEAADGGTLFLDEVADTTPAMQAKLLRVLQDGQVRRVGDDRVRKVDVRVVAASQRPLAELVSAGRFREDLRFRLEVIPITVPPLRERLEDVPRLVSVFVDRLAPKLAGGAKPSITRAALRALQQHAWPGNVRELENAVARACALGGPVIDVEDLPEAVAHARMTAPSPAGDLTLKPALDALERAYVDAALARANGNQTVAARLLGLSRFGLQKKLKRLAE